MKHSPKFLALVEAARRGVRETTVAAIAERRARGEAPTMIDVREDDEWRAGRIPGAIHLGRGVLERDVEARFPDPGAELVLYCGGGFRSVLAAESLARMGYANVVSMDGGMRGWREAGLPEEREPT